MDNRGEIVDEEDRKWLVGCSDHLLFPPGDGAYVGLEDFDESSDGMAYGIREALIAREMGLSEGRGEGRK